MAKSGSIHKNYRKVKVVFTNGDECSVESTYPQDVMKLDVDCTTHPAWTKEATSLNTRASEVAKFNQRYSGMDLFNIGSK
jgi:large subunit ribosomal protein L31